jgi:RNA polymerase sigma-70 factor (ECF subfamily)
VRKVALGIASREFDADDLVQETWLATLRCPPRARTNLRGWLRRVIQRQAINAQVSERARRDRESFAGSHGAVAPGPMEQLDQRALREDLLDAIRALDPLYRDVVLLRYYEELSLPEIARRARLPEETVRTRLRRALEKLRAWFDRRHGNRRDLWMPGLLRVGRPERSLRSRPVLLAGAASICASGLLLFAHGLDDERDAAVVAELAAELDEPRALEERMLAPSRTPMAVESELLGGWLDVQLTLAGGGPAADIRLLLEREGAESDAPSDASIEARTGSDGSWSSPMLEPGLWQVVPARGAPRQLEIEPRERERLVGVVPDGSALDGRVRHANGTAAAFATIWLSWPDRPRELRLVCTCDERGTFHLEGIDRRAWIGARSSGFVDSTLHALRDPGLDRGKEASIELELQGPEYGELHGRVLDASGRPLGGATVEARVELGALTSFDPRWMRDGVDAFGFLPSTALLPWEMYQTPAPVRTDEEGRFAFRGLPLGRWTLVARASGHASAREVARSSEDDVELVLAQGSGASSSRAEAPARVAIAGRAEGASGEPLARRRVGLVEEHGARNWTLTDERGGFRFQGAWGEPVRLELFPEDASPFPVAVRSEVMPGSSDSRLVARPLGSLRGMLVGAGSKATTLWVQPSWDPALAFVEVDPGSGAFSLGGLSSGAYALFAWTRGTLPRKVASIELASGEHRDLEAIVLGASGSLRVRALEAAGLPLASERFCVHSEDPAQASAPLAVKHDRDGNGWLLFPALPSGDYWVSAGGWWLAAEYRPLEIREGQESVLEIALPAREQVRLLFSFPTRDVAGERLLVELFDTRDRPRIRQDLVLSRSLSAPVGIDVELPPGSYRLMARVGKRTLVRPLSIPSGSGGTTLGPFELLLPEGD